MTTPPKAPCHSCNGTGIDPVVGFLDCEFCTPAFAGISLSAPEQPEPKCETCNDHGEIGCLRPDGYDGERCPDCNPAVVKRYHVTEAGLVEGSALGRLNVVLGADFDLVTARLDEARETLERWHELNLQREEKVFALQQRLTAADERADVLEGLLHHVYDADLAARHHQPYNVSKLIDEIEAALKPAEAARCCTVSAEDRALLEAGDYTPEELFGIGGKPSCPKCAKP